MDMTTSFTLTEAGEGTSMAWEADVKIAGPVGSMGQRVLQPIVNQQVQQVLAALEKRVESTAGSGGTGGAEQGIHPAFARGVRGRARRPDALSAGLT